MMLHCGSSRSSSIDGNTTQALGCDSSATSGDLILHCIYNGTASLVWRHMFRNKQIKTRYLPRALEPGILCSEPSLILYRAHEAARTFPNRGTNSVYLPRVSLSLVEQPRSDVARDPSPSNSSICCPHWKYICPVLGYRENPDQSPNVSSTLDAEPRSELTNYPYITMSCSLRSLFLYQSRNIVLLDFEIVASLEVT
jgi:hypothetical protein